MFIKLLPHLPHLPPFLISRFAPLPLEGSGVASSHLSFYSPPFGGVGGGVITPLFIMRNAYFWFK